MILTIFVFIAVLSILVFVHEWGHFWTAKKFGLKPEEFGWGFPPRAIGWYKNKEGKWKSVKGGRKVEDASDTIYSINWLPIGGFVKLGEDDVEISPDANHFNNKSIGQRMIILLAGVTMNIVLAAVLISFGFMIGLPQVIDEDIGKYARVSNEQIQVVSVMKDSPAKSADLEIGDIVVSVDGEAFATTDAMSAFTSAREGQDLNYIIKRGDETLAKTIAPINLESADTIGVGIGIADTGLVRYPIHIAIWEGIKSTIVLTGLIVAAFYNLIKDLVTGQGAGVDIAGPIGIAVLTGQVARMGFVYILQFAALLSINLAIINAFPFPALDGGRVIFLIIEKFKGRPVKKEVEGTIHYIGFALLMLLVLVVTFKDLSRFGDSFRMLWDKLF